MDFSTVKKRLNQLNIRPQKKWGQNFLINPSLSQQIVSLVSDLHPQKVIEVGPGLGSLTEILISLDVPLQVVEVDPVLCDFWRKRNVNVIQENILRLTDHSCFKEKCTLVGNLPYHISSALVMETSISWSSIESMVLMMQKEVASRILSPHKNKNFGLLSVVAQSLWICHSEIVVKATDFYPQPQVDGQILVFKRKPQVDIDLKGFVKFLNICFAQKRKLLKRKLEGFLGKAWVDQTFTRMNLNHLLRAEELSADQYLHLFQYIPVENLTKEI